MTYEEILAQFHTDEASLVEQKDTGQITEEEFGTQHLALARQCEALLVEHGHRGRPNWIDFEDKRTARQIDERIHPSTPVEEQIGILRDQLVAIAVHLGVDLTPKMQEFNTIALEEIQAGIDRKAVLG